MAQNCLYCGTPLADAAKFCPSCGKTAGMPAPGYSGRVNDPEILAAMKKNRKAAGAFGFILVPLPAVGFAIYGLVSDKMTVTMGLSIGLIISAVFLVFALIAHAKTRAQKPYEATVTDKQSHQVYRRSNSDNSRDYTEYITVARTADGREKKIVEREGSLTPAWDYLKVGDRFKYHPQFNFPYELYDKTGAPYIACVSCQTKNPVEADRCKKCGIPLLK